MTLKQTGQVLALFRGEPMRRMLGMQITGWLLVGFVCGCEPDGVTQKVCTNAPPASEKTQSLRLEEQPTEFQAYAKTIAQAEGAKAIAEKIRDAFQTAGSPQPLLPVVKGFYARQQELQDDVEKTKREIEARYTPAPVSPELMHLPSQTWFRVVLIDHRGTSERMVFGVSIKLDDVDKDGECKLKLTCSGEKAKFKGLRASNEILAFGVRVHVESLNPATETVSLLVRRNISNGG